MASQNNDQVQFSIRSFEISEPAKDKDTDVWRATAVARILHNKKYAPDPSLNVILNVVSGESFRLTTDGETGEVAQELVFDKPGSYLVQASVAEYPGVMMTRRVTIKSEERKAKVPVFVHVDVIGSRGEQKLFISVSDGDGKLIPDFKGKLLDGTEKKSFKTGKDGTGLYEMHFDEPSRVVEINLGNTPDLIWTAVIPGKLPTQLNQERK